MQCEYCGNEVQEGAKFCSSCGRVFHPRKIVTTGKLMPNEAAETATKQNVQAQGFAGITCKFCGAAMKPGAIYCMACGKSVATVPPPVTHVSEKREETKSEKKGSGLVVAISIVSALILLVVGVLIYVLATANVPSVPKTSSAPVSSDATETPVVPEVEAEPLPPASSSYQCYKEDATWTQASASAASKGGYLACVNDAQELQELCALAEQNDILVFWVGATRTANTLWDDVRWADGTKLAHYTPWLEGEPTYANEDGTKAELYLLVFKVGDDWYFNDADADEVVELYGGRMGYIVEIEE